MERAGAVLRPRKLSMALVGVAALAVVTVGVWKVNSHTGSTTALLSAPPPGRGLVTTTTTTTTSAPTTTVAPTTTIAPSAQIASVLDFQPVGVYVGQYEGDYYMTVGFHIHSKAGQRIVAYQASIRLSATDSLGRTYVMALLDDCTDPLDPGQVLNGNVSSLEQAADSERTCAAEEWDANQFIAEEIGLWRALEHGSTPHYDVTLNRVSFANGSGIGTAITGTP
ncbi:MAG TPA: hypothetical protein VHA73_13920 [Acidimicrobiales bacterium]|jgi:hypothetical protein|nr:hypothetical protein [Acidimicrobiales bacterium]